MSPFSSVVARFVVLAALLTHAGSSGAEVAVPRLTVRPAPVSTDALLGSVRTARGIDPVTTRELAEETCVTDVIQCGETLMRTLADTDCEAGDGSFIDFFTFQGTAGERVTVEMVSDEFDTFLILVDPSTAGAVFDDDSGAGTNSRIQRTLDESGEWVIGANSYSSSELGDYSLSLQCLGQEGGAPPAAPTNLRIENVRQTAFDFTFDDNAADEDGFEVQYRRGGVGDFQSFGTGDGAFPPNALGGGLLGLEPATLYEVRVRAFNQNGTSAFTNTAAVTTLAPGPLEPCVPGPSTLCLRSDRFQVTGTWRTGAGDTGVMSVVPNQADDSANLWFFSENNWELLVKVLDGCPLNDRFWVFFAATTDVEFTLEVTDTEVGISSVYTNPLGQRANAVTDTAAFATCP